MRSSSRLSTLPQRRLDLGDDRRLALGARRPRPSSARIEARVEQLDDLGGERRVLAQRRPHVVLRIGHADLAQEARDGADQRDVAPRQPGRHHQRVVAVVLGDAAHHHDEARFERAPSARRDRPAPPSARSSTMSCSQTPDRRRRRRDLDRSARRPPGSPCSPAPARAPTAGSAGRGSRPSGRRTACRPRCAMIEIDAERPLRRQRLDDRGCRRPRPAANRPRGSRRRTRRDSAPAARWRRAGSWAAASASANASVQVRTMRADLLLQRRRGRDRASRRPLRPMMKCTRVSGASWMYG